MVAFGRSKPPKKEESHSSGADSVPGSIVKRVLATSGVEQPYLLAFAQAQQGVCDSN